MKRIIVLLLCLSAFVLSFTYTYEGQDPWKVPGWTDTLSNPYLIEPLTLPQAQEVYTLYCKSCHGEQGAGDGPASVSLAVKPIDFKSEKFKKQSDGSIFWKLSEGRGEMPSYKNVLSDEQKWQLVEYVRDLSKPFNLQANPFKSEQ